jgi:hypothetical protein
MSLRTAGCEPLIYELVRRPRAQLRSLLISHALSHHGWILRPYATSRPLDSTLALRIRYGFD